MIPTTGTLSATTRVLRGALWLAAMVATVGGARGAGEFTGQKGAFGSDLGFLAAHHRGPEISGESNHYLELWPGRQTQLIATLHGLTNNRALFINSHGEGRPATAGECYAFIPHDDLLRKGQRAPRYSAKDIARVLGPAQAAAIHNIVSGGCDREGAFSAVELRRHFINATNIVHIPSGEPGVQPMFFQAIVNPSSENKPFYESAIPTGARSEGYGIASAPSDNARRLAPYVAELFRPGEREPFRVQPAGRELLDPSFPAGSPSLSRR